jgi:hypothetical protein
VTVRKEELTNKHKIRTEMLKIIVVKLCFFRKKLKKNKDGRPAVATATTQNTPVLSTILQYRSRLTNYYGSTMSALMQ